MNQRELIVERLAIDIYKGISNIKRTEQNKEVIRKYVSNMVEALDFEVLQTQRMKKNKED